MNKYELILILPGTLDENQTQTTSAAILELVNQYGEGGELVNLGKNRLAYPIKQIRYGYFYTITFSADPMGLKTLQDKLRLHRDVLRFMISHFSVALSQEQKAAYTQGGVANVAAVVEHEIEKSTVATTTEQSEEKMMPASVAKEEKKVDMDEVKKKLDKILDDTDIIPGV
jgi:small subunit ribosomal protein S6